MGEEMILVAGGTGDLGGRVVRLLRSKATRCAVWHGLRPRNPPWVNLVPLWFAAT
jgi:nucleoside-diphosphate-sugar epimerase